MKSGIAAAGIVGSFAMGAIVGVLFAPDKGRNTRNKISKTGRDLKSNAKESAKEAVDYLISSVEKKYDQLVSATETVADAGKQRLKAI